MFAGGSGFQLQVGSDYGRARSDHIVRRAYEAYYDGSAKDRYAWDQLRVLYGSRPSARALWDVSPPGRIRLSEDLVLTYEDGADANHVYGYVNDLEAMRTTISALMLHDPRMSRT